jgi:carbon monoxide dehydrogenase subunit G
VATFTVSTTVKLPREQVFEYLADIANHAEFTDHYLTDWRLTREESYGAGAGARFRVKAPLFNRFAWADFTLAEVSPPFRIVERGRGGKFNRIKMVGIYELIEDPDNPGHTKVSYTYDSDVSVPSDALADALGGRSWAKRQAAKALRRMRGILENGAPRGAKPTVAAR